MSQVGFGETFFKEGGYHETSGAMDLFGFQRAGARCMAKHIYYILALCLGKERHILIFFKKDAELDGEVFFLKKVLDIYVVPSLTGFGS
jgi:hypothetical protein